MKLKLVGTLILALALFLTAVSPSLAATMEPGPGYGNHIADMAQKCSDKGMFSECVKNMSNGTGCTCDGMSHGDHTCDTGM